METRRKRKVMERSERGKEEILNVQFINPYIGHGVFPSESIEENELLCFYEGEFISNKEGERRLNMEGVGSFLFFFSHKGKKFCIDATNGTGVGKMINDDHKRPNCKVKVLPPIGDGPPRLGVFSRKKIQRGEELRFDYGDIQVPWRKKNVEYNEIYHEPVPLRRVFVSSGHKGLKKQLEELVRQCGGEYSSNFISTATHVIMHTDETRQCSRSLKYFLGIAHHCWILDQYYVEKCLRAGSFLPEEPFEVLGDDVFPNGLGASLSRSSKRHLLNGVEVSFTGECPEISTDAAGLIVQSLGGEVKENSNFIISLDDKGESGTVTKEWLFDCLSNFTVLDSGVYLSTEPSEDLNPEADNDDEYIPNSEDEDSDDTDMSVSEAPTCASNISEIREKETSPLSGSNNAVIPRDDSLSEMIPDNDDNEDEYIPNSEDEDSDDTDMSVSEAPTCASNISEIREKETSPLSGSNNAVIPRDDSLSEMIPDNDDNEDEYIPNSEDEDSDDTDMSVSEAPTCARNKSEIREKETSPLSGSNNAVIPRDDSLSEMIPDNDDNEDEYIPNSEDEDSDDTDMSVSEAPTCASNISEIREKETSPLSGSNNAVIPRDDSLSEIIPDNDDNEDEYIPTVESDKSDIKMFVSMSKKNAYGGRVWNKKYFCIYCSKEYAKLPRHLQSVHEKEIEVQRALAHHKNSKERKQAWKILSNKGNFTHNITVYKQGNGEIIPCKRPGVLTPLTDYVQCKECYGTYSSRSLWRHVKAAHPLKKIQSEKRISHQVESASLLPVSSIAKENFKKNILDKMANDHISLVSRLDDDIVNFGQRQFSKYSKYPHQFNYIRQKMRELSRFLLTAREIDPAINTLRDCIDPVKFPICISTVKSLCGYDESTQLFRIPSLANKLGHSLHKIARKIRLIAMRTAERDIEERAERFIELYREEWTVNVGHAALETIEAEKYNKPMQLPLAEDLQQLSSYLKRKADTIMEMTNISNIEWRILCEVTLAQLVLFNKRRAGETERMEVDQYIAGLQCGKSKNSEVMESLSPLEKKMIEVIDRVEIRGKRGRKVAVLIPANLKAQMDVLLQYRLSCNIVANNKYMFARTGESETPIRATDVLRRYAAVCGAKQPDTLTSTGFRKHVATISQMLNLKDNELDILAAFLGHDIRIHREFYRLPSDIIQVAKVSKLLIELEKGHITKYKGKSLDEIQFDLDEPIEEETEKKKEKERETVVDRPSATRRLVNKKQWSEEEGAAVARQLGKYFHLDRLPGKNEIVLAQQKDPVLSKRPWSQIKFYVKNKKASKNMTRH